MVQKLTVAHDEIRHLIDVIHYDDHPARVESSLFRHNKQELHRQIDIGEIPACFINNGHCEGQTEIHHWLVEYSAGNEVEWNIIQLMLKNYGIITNIANPDEKINLVPLCHKHHMGTGTGIHMITFPAWILQKFLNQKNIALFEAAIAHIKQNQHPRHENVHEIDHHLVNARSQAILKKLGAA